MTRVKLMDFQKIFCKTLRMAIAPLNRDQKILLLTMMIGTFMAALDGSIVNISLPPMAKEFGATLTSIEWVVLSYMIGFAVSIPLTGWLRDNLGFRWLYMGSLSVFVIGSALCGFAPSLEFLVAARVIQALGGGALTPTAMAILSTAFPARERGRAIGIWGLGVVIGPAIGPTLGGLLTGQFGWSSVFLINLPIGVVGIFLAARVLRDPKFSTRSPSSFDLVGFASLSIFLISILMGVNSLSGEGSTSHMLLLWLLVFTSLAIFLHSSLRSPKPLMNLRLFKNRQFLNCILVTMGRSGVLYGGMFLLPFLMQTLLGFSEVKSGLLMLPGSLLVAVLMPLSGRWADAKGPRGITLAGILLLSASMAVLGLVPMNATVLMILTAMSLRGIGLGLLAAPVSTATVNSVKESEITLASTFSSLLQQCGGAIGVSVFALIHQWALRSGGSETVSSEAWALKFSFFTTATAFLFVLIPAVRLPKTVSGQPHKETTEMLVE